MAATRRRRAPDDLQQTLLTPVVAPSRPSRTPAPRMRPTRRQPPPALRFDGPGHRKNPDGTVALRVAFLDGPHAGQVRWLTAPLPVALTVDDIDYEIGHRHGIGFVAVTPPPWRTDRRA